jgi:hypothetical protein
MSSNAEFEEELPGDIPVASSAVRRRVFLDQTDGFFKTKDSLGNVAPIATLALPFIHNAPVTNAMSPYVAAIQETVKVDVDTGAITVLLPTAIGSAGSQIKVVSLSDTIGPNPCTIVPFGPQTINGDPSKVLLTPRERYTLESDGANWLVVD